jgi:sterol-4alpha-carboxylate 3-dehydrogenase (decarboxylating)
VSAVHLDPTVNHRPINEAEAKVNDWTSPASAYSRAKGSTETLVLGSGTDATTVDFSENADWRDKILTTTLRVTGLYGPRDKTTLKELLAIVNTFATRIQVGPNRLVHSWCFVDSAASAHVDAAKALLDGKHLQPSMRVDGESFFIADPEPMKFWNFTRAVQREARDEFCNSPEEHLKPIVIPFWVMMTVAWVSEWLYWIFTFGTKRPRMTLDHFEGMARGYWFSVEKARVRLGWEPACNTEEGIRRSVSWFNENPNWETEM